jgi:Glycosyltransferase like family
MIAFGVSITSPGAYRKFAEPGIRRAAEPDSEVWAFAAAGSIFRSYNLLLETAAARDDLEALVLVHQDAEIVDADFCHKVRRALSDPEVGVVGCVGAIGVRSIAWWEGSVTWASFVHRYGEHGGGDLPAFAWNADEMPPYARTGEVDTVDGFLIALSPWTVRNIRFDESLGQLHGYDFDFCLQVRAAGRKVVTEDFKAIHNHSLDLVSDQEGWMAAHVRIAEKWLDRMPGVGDGGGDWKHRALHAEAAAEAGRAAAVSTQLQSDARELELQRALDETTGSISWRMTAPLRRANELRRAALARLRERRS